MPKIFTESELRIARMKIDGLMNKEIAQKLKVSEPDVSQTLNRLRKKIHGVQDSLRLLQEVELIHEAPILSVTEKGKKLVDVSKELIKKKEFPATFPLEWEVETTPEERTLLPAPFVTLKGIQKPGTVEFVLPHSAVLQGVIFSSQKIFGTALKQRVPLKPTSSTVPKIATPTYSIPDVREYPELKIELED